MKIQWLYLLLALAVTFPPMPFSGTFQKSLRSFQRRNIVSFADAIRVWQNWIDLARGAIGGRNLAYQLPAMLAALLSAGYVLGLDLRLVLACGLILLPMILSALLRKKLHFAAVPPTLASSTQ